jgi:digeranylgeranylglycerophospholipid reductase
MYDVIVVGGGSAGLWTAKTAVENGCKVLLIDKRAKDDIGRKISYDSTPPYVFEQLGIPLPSGKELDDTGDVLTVISPNKKHRVEAAVPNVLFSRRLLGQRLAGYAADAGVEFMYRTEVVGPVIEDGYVVGVRARHLDSCDEEEIRARIVVDASGFYAVIRRKLPPEILVQDPQYCEDVVLGYREVRRIVGESNDCPPPEYRGYYDYLGYHGGYLWIVREENNWANIGIGVQDYPGNPGPVRPVQEFADDNPAIGPECMVRGSGDPMYIPLRSCQPQLSANGFMMVGDAACQVRPSTGYGWHTGLLAGDIAGKVAAEAVKKQDVSREALWDYDVGWKRGLGAILASFDAIRIMCQSVPNDELDFLLAKGILGSEQIEALWNDKPFEVGTGKQVSSFFAGIGHTGLLLKVKSVIDSADKLYKLFLEAPDSPEGFEEWNRERVEIFTNLRAKLGVKVHEKDYFGEGMKHELK